MITRRPLFVLLTTFVFVLLAGAVVVAQVAAPATCPAMVLDALRTVNDLCHGQGRNSACYGNYLVEAQLAAEQPAGLFDARGDIAALNALTSLRTAPLNVGRSEWGVSILSVQANLPGALPGQSALFLLLGGAEIESAVAPDQVFAPADPPLRLQAVADAALRENPAEDAPVVRSVMPGDDLVADTRSGDFLRVTAGNQFGWIHISQTNANAASAIGLPEFVEGESFTPMQAFYLRTGIGTPACAQAPSALVIQGPENLHVDIQANGADISLGSTIILRTYSVEEARRAGLQRLMGGRDVGGLLELSVIDGRVKVRQEDGAPVFIHTGEQAYICLDKVENLGVDGRNNDQPVTYVCGGWSVPAPIPPQLRDDFSLVDDYPLIYPVDIITPTPTTPPVDSTQVPSLTPESSAADPVFTPEPTPAGGHANLTLNVNTAFTPAAGRGLAVWSGAGFQPPWWIFDTQVSVINNGTSPASGVTARGMMPRSGDAVAQVSQGTYDPAQDVWRIGLLPVGGQASLHLMGVVSADCGEIISGAVRVLSLEGVADTATYSVTAECAPPDATQTATATLTSISPTATASNTFVPPTAAATNTPVPPTATASNTFVPPTATASNTFVPPTATATNTPVPPAATATNTPVPPAATASNTPVPPTETPAPEPSDSYRVTFCHNYTTTLQLPAHAAYDVHLNPDGMGRSGEHQYDYLGACRATPESP